MSSPLQTDFNELMPVKGYIAADGWISPSLLARAVPNKSADVIRIRLWNPNSSPRFDKNTLYVAYGDQSETRTDIRLGEFVEIALRHRSVESQSELLTIISKYRLPPDDKDRRTRGVLLVELILRPDEQPRRPRVKLERKTRTSSKLK